MLDILSALFNTLIQILVFGFLPFLWWFITKRKEESFFAWLGFKKPIIADKKALLIVILIILVVIPIAHFYILSPFLTASDLATSQFEGTGLSLIVPIFLYAFIQTSLAEEVFFRGFLCKRLSAKFGFNIGNLIQGLLFGLLHGAIFFQITGLKGAIIISLIIFADGCLLGFMNEKLSSGSILPSWLAHSLSNLLVSLLSAFSIL